VDDEEFEEARALHLNEKLVIIIMQDLFAQEPGECVYENS